MDEFWFEDSFWNDDDWGGLSFNDLDFDSWGADLGSWGGGSGDFIDFDVGDWSDSDWTQFDFLDQLGASDWDFTDWFSDTADMGSSWFDGLSGDFFGTNDSQNDFFGDMWNVFNPGDDGTMDFGAMADWYGLDSSNENVLSTLETLFNDDGSGGGSLNPLSFLSRLFGGSSGSGSGGTAGNPGSAGGTVLGDSGSGLLGLASMLAGIFADDDPASVITNYQYPPWAMNALSQRMYELGQQPLNRDEYTGTDQIPWPFPYVDEYEDRLTDMTDFSTGDRSVWDVIQNGNMNDYMSAYTDAVLQPVLKDMDDRYALDMNEINRKAGMMNAYGTERDRLYKDELTDTYMENRNQTISNAYDSAWKDATGLAGTDTDRRYTAMSDLPGLYNQLGDDRMEWEKFNVEFPYEIFDDRWNYNPTITNAIASATRNLIPSQIDNTRLEIPARDHWLNQLLAGLATQDTSVNGGILGQLFGGLFGGGDTESGSTDEVFDENGNLV